VRSCRRQSCRSSLAAVNGFHVQGMAEHEGNLLTLAQVGDPVPGEHALDADHQAVAEGRDGLEQRFRRLARFLSKTALPSWSRTQTCMVLACRSMPQ